ncbi:MAG: 5-oxoprolinase subunit PxpB [Bacteroidota bacterium]
MRRPRQIQHYGKYALLLDWEQKIDPDINSSVHLYADTIQKHPAVIECIPAYCSLLVTFDQTQVNHFTLREWIYDMPLTGTREGKGKHHDIPVVYGGEFGPDLLAVTQFTGLSEKRIIALHTSLSYRVYQLGYQPGFAFMGLTNPALEVPRRPSPRVRVAPGSVGIAGRQTGIYPHEAPGGWQLIGRTPRRVWQSSGAPNTLFRAGDTVRFYAIPATNWEQELTNTKQVG